MGKILKKCALILCLLVLCFSAMGIRASAASSVTANIPVEIVLRGTAPVEQETFVVELTADVPSNPMPAGAENGIFTMKMSGNSSDTIGITFDKPGVYDYTLRLLTGANADCRYDEAVYHVTVFVTNSKSGSGYDLSIVVYRSDETEKQDNILFEIIYADPAEVIIAAVKTLDGKTPKDGAFAFELLNSDDETVGTVRNVGRSITFETLYFNQTGIYRYRLKEVPGNDGGILYDSAEYEVIIEVTKDDEGNYSAVLTWAKNGKSYSGTPVFENISKTNSPQTGDGNPIQLWMLLLLLSVFGMIILKRNAPKSDGE